MDAITYSYIGSVQIFTSPFEGTFKLEAWGDQGGNQTSVNNGGKGAYATGLSNMNTGDKIKELVEIMTSE